MSNSSVLEKVQGGGGNRNQTPANNKVSYLNKSYVEGLNNIESCRVNKSKNKIIRYGQDWYWCLNHNMEGKLYGIYVDHPSKKNDEWYEENKSNREA